MNRIGKKDQAVIHAFVDKRPMSGLKLDTDGHRLDGAWMGGSDIASWEHDKIVFNNMSSRSTQQVQRAIAKAAPKFDLLNGRGW